MTNGYLSLFLASLSAIVAFGVFWSLKNRSTSQHYLIGRDVSRIKNPLLYWLIVGSNALIAITLLGCSIYILFNPPSG